MDNFSCHGASDIESRCGVDNRVCNGFAQGDVFVSRFFDSSIVYVVNGYSFFGMRAYREFFPFANLVAIDEGFGY